MSNPFTSEGEDTDYRSECRELQAELAVKDALILELGERLLICSALLSRWAERPEFRRKTRQASGG